MQGLQRTAAAKFTFILLITLLLVTGTMLVRSSAKAASPIMATYYVSPTGSDANPGTINQPFKSIDHARVVVAGINHAMTGDIVVYVRRGTYNLTSPLNFTSKDSGTNGYTVSYQAYPGEKPVISGGRTITGWSLHDASKHIWQASVGSGLQTRELYVNGARAQRARSQGGLPGAVRTATGYTTSDTTMQNWRNPSDIEFVTDFNWIEDRCKVQSIVGTTITMQEPCFANSTNSSRPGGASITIDTPTYIENAYELLDQPGEWYLDHAVGMLYYIPRSSENMSNAQVVAPVLETLVNGTGTLDAPLNHITFQGLTFAYATWLGPDSGDGYSDVQTGFHLTGTNWQNATPYGNWTRTPGNITFHGSTNVSLLDDTFTHLGAVGVNFEYGIQNAHIQGNIFTDISSTALQLGDADQNSPSDSRLQSLNNQILDNLIHDVGKEYHDGAGVWAGYEANLMLSHNEIYNIPGSGVSLGWFQGSYDANNTISYNHIHDFRQTVDDQGGIYVVGGTSSSQPSHMTGNWVQGEPGDTAALYLDNYSSYWQVTSNVVAQVAQCWLYLQVGSTSTNNTVQNNYHDTTVEQDGDSSNTVSNNPLVSDGNWPVAAQAIMNNAGLEPAYQSLKGLVPNQGLNLWLKADGPMTQNGSTVARWDDVSGSGNDASQGICSAQPALVLNTLNGLPVVRFDGSSTCLTTAAPVTTSTQYSMFVVSTLGGVNGPIYNGLPSTNGYGFYRSNSADYGLNYGGVSAPVFGPTQTSGFQTLEAQRDSSGTTTFYQNGTPSGGTSTATPNEPSNLTTIGGLWSNQIFQGDIAEILVYNRALSTTERQQVEQYLHQKYFVPRQSLPSHGLVLSLDGDHVLFNGPLTTQWFDLSGHGNRLVVNFSDVKT